MSKLEERDLHHYIRLSETRMCIYCWKNGDKEIKIHNVPKALFEKTAALLGAIILEHTGTRWFCLAKARDGSKVTFFEA